MILYKLKEIFYPGYKIISKIKEVLNKADTYSRFTIEREELLRHALDLNILYRNLNPYLK